MSQREATVRPYQPWEPFGESLRGTEPQIKVAGMGTRSASPLLLLIKGRRMACRSIGSARGRADCCCVPAPLLPPGDAPLLAAAGAASPSAAAAERERAVDAVRRGHLPPPPEVEHLPYGRPLSDALLGGSQRRCRRGLGSVAATALLPVKLVGVEHSTPRLAVSIAGGRRRRRRTEDKGSAGPMASHPGAIN